MKTDIKEHTKNMKQHAENGIAVTREWAHTTKDRIFNMEIAPAMERVLKNRLQLIAIISLIIGAILLIAMIHSPRYFLTALVIGLIGAAIDFAVEYKGITQNDWNYPVRYLSFRKIPIELPLLFFNCGILATFTHYAFSNPHTYMFFEQSAALGGFNYAQIALIATGTFFLAQYFMGTIKSLTFGALPLALALYLSYPTPWMLVISIVPVYIDYYLERRMVRSAHITYDLYGEEVATHVAISYFPVTLIILGLVTIILHYI